MSYTFLQAREGESWEECSSDTPQFALWKLNLTAGESCYNDSGTASCHVSRYGTMCEHSTGSRGEEKLMSCAPDSRARESVQLGQTATSTGHLWELMERAASFGRTFRASLSSVGIQTCLLRIPNTLSLADCRESFRRLMPLGMSADGVCLGLAISAPIMNESDCGSRLPTPTAHNSKEGAYPAEFTRNTPTLAAQIGGKINPDWNEWRMGWPIKWTDLKPLATDKFQQWCDSHGKL